MATLNRFEDINAWKEARKLSQLVYDLSKRDRFAKDFGLKDQINRSTGSVMDNIAEGFGRGGVKEFIQFLGFSRGSIAEVQSQLIRAYDREYISKEEFEDLCNQTESISKMISGLIKYLKSSEYKGFKFK